MTYRIHFTTLDLARTRVTDAPMPGLELNFATRILQNRSQPARLDAWRRRARARLTGDARMALSLVPPFGYSPTFISPSQVGAPEEVLEGVRATPQSAVAAELAAISERQPIPSWARRLADDPELYAKVSDGVDDLYRILLKPHWAQITDLLRADRAVRTRQLLAGGIERVLAEANPRWMRWKPPVLEIRMPNGVERDLRLEGQGVILMPTVFHPRTLVDDEGTPQPIISYPAGLEHPLRSLTVVAPTGAVAALLGTTRSAVLTVIAEHPGSSTKELAALARIAPASASEHATVLRDAGLISTVRYRNTALHSVTNLGLALLNAPRHSP
ncbi:MAG: winged helix-turn-helix domain-containing protein [Actinoallomurus sp.]